MTQWICFAVRPLSVTELRFAMASDCLQSHESLHFCHVAKDFVEDDERMEKLFTTLSGGCERHGVEEMLERDQNSAVIVSKLRVLRRKGRAEVDFNRRS